MQEGSPESGIGRAGALFPDDRVQIEACRFGAYLDDPDQFDAAFFRVSPVEAQLLDPHQRLMLETSWRALEDTDVDAERLKGSRTGVYARISNYDYRGLILDAGENAEPAGWAANLYAVTGQQPLLGDRLDRDDAHPPGRVALALGDAVHLGQDVLHLLRIGPPGS